SLCGPQERAGRGRPRDHAARARQDHGRPLEISALDRGARQPAEDRDRQDPALQAARDGRGRKVITADAPCPPWGGREGEPLAHERVLHPPASGSETQELRKDSKCRNSPPRVSSRLATKALNIALPAQAICRPRSCCCTRVSAPRRCGAIFPIGTRSEE